MARFAAADSQVTGILQDIQSLRRLEGRLDALEGRHAPDKGVEISVPLPAPLRDEKKKKRKKRRRKGKAAMMERLPGPSRTPKTAATPQRVSVRGLRAPPRRR